MYMITGRPSNKYVCVCARVDNIEAQNESLKAFADNTKLAADKQTRFMVAEMARYPSIHTHLNARIR